ncbi:MAG: serine/threonine-protein kinase [Pseudomonadales bacterium]
MAMAEGQLLDYLETGVALPENELERWLASLPLAQADRTRLTRLLASAPAAADRFDLANYCLQIVARVGPGDMVGRFRLEREIGRGGMARVFHARRVAGDFDQDVAIKFVDAGIVAPQVKSLFERERQILAGLRHPNIASLYDGGEHDGLAYIVMEYVEGKAIDAYCRQHASTARDVVRLFVQLCAGVQAAHNALVVHGDIKPSNVLVTEAGLPKLLDFGIARLAERDNSIDSQTFGGTLTYAAPEQIRREQLATAADVFSLGILLIELLDGARAWPGLAPEATAAQRLTHYRTARPHSDALSGELAAIARKASAFAPDQRYASAGALSEDLVRFLRGYPVVAMPQDRGYFLRCFVRRNRLPVVLAGGVLLSLVLGLTLTTWQFLRADREREQAQQTLGVLKDVILSPSRWSKLTTGNDLLLSTQSTTSTGRGRLAPRAAHRIERRSIWQSGPIS